MSKHFDAVKEKWTPQEAMSDKNTTTTIDMFKACLAILTGYPYFNLSTYLIVSPLVALLFGRGGHL